MAGIAGIRGDVVELVSKALQGAHSDGRHKESGGVAFGTPGGLIFAFGAGRCSDLAVLCPLDLAFIRQARSTSPGGSARETPIVDALEAISWIGVAFFTVVIANGTGIRRGPEQIIVVRTACAMSGQVADTA